MANEPIGRASATERDHNSADQFQFWIKPNYLVNPFDIVSAEHYVHQDHQSKSLTFGLVTNIHHLTDASGHLTNYISNDFGETVIEEPQSQRQAVNVAEVAVLSNSQHIYMPVQNESPVRFAEELDIHKALGIEGIPENRRIPAGIIRMSNGTQAIAYLDCDFILGPEASHINISGISGLATKTSYAMFLIQSILQKSQSNNIATILLNVKYDDLLTLHESRDLSYSEREMWKRLGLDPRPWDLQQVHYILPWGKNSHLTKKPNSFIEEPLIPHQTYAYALRETVDKLDLLFSDIPDSADTLSSLLGEIREGISNDDRTWQAIQTWDDLWTKPPLVQQGIPQKFRNIQTSSVGRFLRLLKRVVKTRQSGIFVPQLSTRMTTVEEVIGNIKGGHTYVVDIARLTPEEQTLVFGDVLRTVYGLYSGESSLLDEYEPPEKVIIFVDELNKYAPARGQAQRSPILEQVLDIAERGRAFGMILFSAQQFLSAVHPRVTGNSATKVLGRSDSSEINGGEYDFLNKDIRHYLTRLDKGELILSHPIYRQPVKIAFPRPPFMQGKARR